MGFCTFSIFWCFVSPELFFGNLKIAQIISFSYSFIIRENHETRFVGSLRKSFEFSSEFSHFFRIFFFEIIYIFVPVFVIFPQDLYSIRTRTTFPQMNSTLVKIFLTVSIGYILVLHINTRRLQINHT